MHFRELDTPALFVDLDILEKNLASMTAYCREHSLALRPHTAVLLLNFRFVGQESPVVPKRRNKRLTATSSSGAKSKGRVESVLSP